MDSFKSFPEIRTVNLILRQIEEADAEDVFSIRSNEEVGKYTLRTPPKSIKEAIDFIKIIIQGFKKQDSFYWIIEKDNQFTGSICLWKIDKEKGNAELGFELFPKYQGKGIMQEVIPVILNFGFNKLELESILAETAKENIKSIGLLKKYNFNIIQEDKETFLYELKRKDYDNR